MRKYDFEGYKIFLQNTFMRDSYGKFIVKYKMINPEGVILFDGKNFHCSPMHDPESYDAAISLLGFLTLKPGDTDAEHFDNYTPKQMEFCESWDCEELSLIVCDYETQGE